MPVSNEYIEYIKEQLRSLGKVTARKMFGGAGLYYDNKFFALIADDILYFKVDESNKADYEESGSKPFQPFGEKSYKMNYYEVPVDILENPDELGRWANKAIEVAKNK